jgi:anthranilate synthase component 1
MIYPDIEQFKKDSAAYNVLPIYQKIRADFETALSIFVKVNGIFLLESIERGENVGRYSIIAVGQKCRFTLNGNSLKVQEFSEGKEKSCLEYQEPNPLNRIRDYFKQFKIAEYENLPPFFGGAIGYLGYETIQYFEEIPVKSDEQNIPDGVLIIPETVIVYDMVKRTAAVVVPVFVNQNHETQYKLASEKIGKICRQIEKPLSYTPIPISQSQKLDVETNMSKDNFLDCIKKCKEHIRNGDIIQVVFSQKFLLKTQASPFELYRTLRIMNPSPYLYYMNFGDFCIVGSSPEVMVRVQNGEILLKPIAGTRPRGKTIAEDNAIARELLNDPKECAEHIMLVDLGRNDLGRVAAPGSVEVSDYMTIEKYSHVMHIVSTVKAELDPTYDVFDVIRATFPAGTLTGAPKIRAMEIIAGLETEKRGPYGGMILNLGFNGHLDSCITIRTIVIKDGLASVQAGAGIVADSVAEREFIETVNKAGALLETIKQTLY